MKIELTQTAKKQLKKLPTSEVKKIARKLRALAVAPYSGKKLEGKLEGRYAMRAWPYRIIYVIVKSAMYIDAIEHRQSVYK